MTGIVIGAGKESIYAIQTARKAGHTIIAFDGDESAAGLSFADYPVVADIKNPPLIIEYLKDKKPDFILPIPIGRYLTTAGFINDYLNLKGISEKSCILCTDKLLFHERMKEHNLRPVDCMLIKEGETHFDCPPFPYPLILKPRFGSGSRAVTLIKNPDELDTEITNKLPLDEDFILESALEGEEYGIDAAVIDSVFHLILLRKKIITPPPHRQCVAYASISTVKDNLPLLSKVAEYMKCAVSALHMNQCLLHADLMIKPDLTVTAIEISARPSGHRLHDVFTPMASGIQMIPEYLNFLTGASFQLEPSSIKSLAIRYFDFANCRIVKQPDVGKLRNKYRLLDYHCNIGEEYLNPITDGHSIMDRGYFIIEGRNSTDALEQCEEILSLFEKVDE